MYWIATFIQHKTCLIVMIASSSYYFNSSAEKDGKSEVGLGFEFSYLKHAGSCAYGSLLISLITLLKYTILILAEKAYKATGDSPFTRCMVCCGGCVMKVLETACDYINKTAYSYMAVSGESFCSSAWCGFLLNMKHAAEFFWANVLARIFITLGIVLLCLANCYSFYLIMDMTGELEQVNTIFIPMGIVALFTYLSSSIFLGIFDEIVLALLTCMCVDVELNLKPKYGPPQFHKLIDNFFVDLDDEAK